MLLRRPIFKPTGAIMPRLALTPSLRWIAVCCFVISNLTSVQGRADAATGVKLAIVSAVYGDLDNEKTTDVLKKVAQAVKDNNLNLTVTKDRFGDPAPGAAKKLKVGYTLDALYYTKTIDDGHALDISPRPFIRKAANRD